ncbi:hypothetical protein CN200_01505 [Sinorhizobium meliloti]|nr:hypothetical protein CN200_01505 [Sinorhizobium meliloti]RVN91475.1 hypothetical protein CN107_07695 [Sinorhizobium meliloti]RVO14989.1 hypothetical protein CN103_06025 [Sinorhizobium meliloti]
MLHEGAGLRVACRHPEVGIDRDYEIRDRTKPSEDLRLCSRPCPLPHHAGRLSHLGLADDGAALLRVAHRGPQHPDRSRRKVGMIRVEHVAVRIDECVSGPGFEFRCCRKGAPADILEERRRRLWARQNTTCFRIPIGGASRSVAMA